MGTENLYHKRKAKQNNDIKRKKAKRDPYDRVLIVCQSVPSDLEAICEDLKLNSANIKICGKECGSAPANVVEYAKQSMKKDSYDKVYCIIDRDKHPNFHQALQKATDNKIEVIISIPCFEYWLLLHFEYTSCPFQVVQGSNCNEVIKALKKHWSEYEKGTDFKYYYHLLKRNQNKAIAHAKQRETECQHESKSPHSNLSID